ncbi:MAG: hypothetical protein J1F17_00800 [Oscillospiraceae bacterium]|nr:hypothetical protein [Oscillospiraceae bacterium]
MIKKLFAVLIIICLILGLSACGFNEISKKLVADAVIVTDSKMSILVDSKDEMKIYDTDFDTVESSVEKIKEKYDYELFLSHSKAIIVSTEVTIKELSDIIQKFKFYYQISPDTKVILAEDNALKALKKGDFTTKEINTIIKNKKMCDDRICNYDTVLTGKDFEVIFDKEGEIEVRKITL